MIAHLIAFKANFCANTSRRSPYGFVVGEGKFASRNGSHMQAFALSLLIVSSALSLSVVSLGLSAIARCIGVVPLEVLPLGIGFSLGFLSLCGRSSPSTLSGEDVLPLVLCCAVLLFFLHPVYVQWRLRIGGESISLMFSFALMTCWIRAMSIATDSRSFSPNIPEFLRANQSLGLKLITTFVCLVVLATAAHLSTCRGRLAALQLSLGDSRLLSTFGLSSSFCQRVVLALSILFIVVGSMLYICLQQNFSFQNSYDIVVPAFAISLSQTRIRIPPIIAVSIILLAGIEYLTELSAESTIREGHQALLFGFVVVITLIARIASLSGRSELFKRRLQYRLHEVRRGSHG
jgi:hypothetical protein